MKNLAIVIAGALISIMTFVLAFAIASAIGGVAWLFIEGVEVVDNAITFATYSGIFSIVVYIYLIWSGRVKVVTEDEE